MLFGTILGSQAIALDIDSMGLNIYNSSRARSLDRRIFSLDSFEVPY